jgi:hypothetical protein
MRAVSFVPETSTPLSFRPDTSVHSRSRVKALLRSIFCRASRKVETQSLSPEDGVLFKK